MEALVTFHLFAAFVILVVLIAKGVNYGVPAVNASSQRPSPARNARAGVVRETIRSEAAKPQYDNRTATYVDDWGYLRYKYTNKAVHREVMEQKFGRKLHPEEVVHHCDRNKQNNEPRNLWVYKNQAEHDAQHKRDAEKYGEWWSYNGSKR